jgi:hypothetical protein
LAIASNGVKMEWNTNLKLNKPPKPKWQMDFFGDGNLVFQFQGNKNLWQRFWCSIIFGTKWKKL